MRIEAFRASDYEALGELLNRVYPDYPGYMEELRHQDASTRPPQKAARWLARDDSGVLGMTEYVQYASRYHPRKFSIDVQVRPDAEGRGIGRALYEHLTATLAPFEPLALYCAVREDKRRGLAFATDRGFAVKMRNQESRLTVADFDPALWEDVMNSARAQGFDIKSLAELADDPDRDRKLYELRNAVIRDVPSVTEHTDEDFERFLDRFWSNPALIAEACHVALDGERYVGYTQLFDSHGADLLYTGLTGVLREYRGRGLATALKVHGVRWAKAAGKTEIMTWNEVGNEGMLGINARLGFERKLAWIDYELKIGEENTSQETGAE